MDPIVCAILSVGGRDSDRGANWSNYVGYTFVATSTGILSLHCKLLHLPFLIMLQMSKLGFLPKRFLKLRNDIPPCIDCLFGQAHCRPWRTKGSYLSPSRVLKSPSASKPGQTVGTDQLVSIQPGMVPQWKGHMTRARIWGATIFVDYSTKWIKVHLMQEATGEETLEACWKARGSLLT